MIIFHMVLFGFLALLLLNATVNAALIPTIRPPGKRAQYASPLVSVLVPARNEERNIRACLESLLKQNYPNLEIIVLDDRSDDSTSDIIAELGFIEDEDASLRKIAGEELPQGWAGKNWACHQLSEQANGRYLIFTDADTKHEIWSVSAAVAFSEKYQASLVSIWPDHITKTWSERWIQPLLCVLGAGVMSHLVAWMVIWSEQFAKRAPRVLLEYSGAANGQYLCFSRDGYSLVGGHAARKDDLVEDVSFGRETLLRAAQGGRLVNVDGKHALQCRMYQNFNELWEGFSKNVWPVFRGQTGIFVISMILSLTLMVLPFCMLPFCVGTVKALVLAEIAAILAFRLLIALRYGSSLWGVVFHIPAVLLGITIGANSFRLARKGQLRWKGRTYKA